MSWERPPEPRRPRRLAFVAIAAFVVIVAGIAAAQIVPDSPDALTIFPSEDPATTDDDVTDLEPEIIAPISRSTDVAGTGALLPDTSLTIVAADFSARLQMVDVATGAVKRLELLGDPIRQRPDTIRFVGTDMLVDVDDMVIRITNDAGRPVVLARNHHSISSDDPNSVWVYDGVTGGVGGIASRLDLDGTVLDEVELATLTRPLAGAPDGLLVAAADSVSWIGTDGSRREIARGQAVASDGTRLARLECTGNRACSVVTGTVDNPEQIRTQLRAEDVPVGLFGAPQGQFSPDGRWLALPMITARQTPGAGNTPTAVVVFDVTIGAEALRIDGSALTQPATPLAWSPDSRWLVASTGTALRAWSTETFAVTDLDVRLSPTYAISAR